MMYLIPNPPAVPSPIWLRAFADELLALKPRVPREDAMRSARLAHAGTWLLDPEEAAQWWIAALEAVARDLPPLPGGQPRP